jgi:hypothetical protein
MGFLHVHFEIMPQPSFGTPALLKLSIAFRPYLALGHYFNTSMSETLGSYLKAAFTWRWNLLALAGGAAFALLSPVPAAGLAVLAAVEIAYLTTLVSFPKFRRAIDASSRAPTPPPIPEREIPLSEVLNQLAPGPRKRFLELRQRCLTLQNIANKIGGGATAGTNLRTTGLDKLLWVQLRLLLAQQGLWGFLDETDVSTLDKQLGELQKRQEAAATDERMLKSLTDAIATVTMRIENVRAAQRNSEFVGLELERIENKILALSEMAVNNQNPDFITAQVDAVADSMTQTESAIRELDSLTGLSRELTREPPRILQSLVN